jgi:hypothetical protein
VKLTAQVTQLQEHLPPADTIVASVQFENGSVGTVNISFGMAQYSSIQGPRFLRLIDRFKL